MLIPAVGKVGSGPKLQQYTLNITKHSIQYSAFSTNLERPRMPSARIAFATFRIVITFGQFLSILNCVHSWITPPSVSRLLPSKSRLSTNPRAFQNRHLFTVSKHQGRHATLFLVSDHCLPSRMEGTTLAGDYVVVLATADATAEWSIYPIAQVLHREDAQTYQADGAKAKRALEIAHEETSATTPVFKIIARQKPSTTTSVKLEVATEVLGEIRPDETIIVLEKVFAQWAYKHLYRSAKIKTCEIVLSREQTHVEVELDQQCQVSSFRRLFATDVEIDSVEWVEMVTGAHHGNVLGQVPRTVVHQHNLLHRGIGAFVTANFCMPLATDDTKVNFPDIYVHRRADTKRVFPSLYDMFVGGVSLAGEDAFLTAQREVAEELGLSAAVLRGTTDADIANSGWNSCDPLLTCVVCTGYNRCVVTLFSYTMQTDQESISWQKEEVSWGCFVPHRQVVAEANESIQRLSDQSDWPGIWPPIRFESNGEMGMDSDTVLEGWDFVPDGLLVWEAWLKHAS